MSKPILCLDFDGVIHSYANGWKGAHVIPDPPVPGAISFLLNALDPFNVAIFSSRMRAIRGTRRRSGISAYRLPPKQIRMAGLGGMRSGCF